MLFVGGASDGENRDVGDNNKYRIAKPNIFRGFRYDGSVEQPVRVAYEDYRVVTINTKDRQFKVMGLEGMTSGDIIEKLIGVYSKQSKSKWYDKVGRSYSYNFFEQAYHAEFLNGEAVVARLEEPDPHELR